MNKGESCPRTKLHTIIYTLVLVVCVFLCVAFPVTAADDAAEQPVRIGYDTSGRYLYQDSRGEYRGFTIEYLYEITKYTGWTYDFVPFSSWSDAVQALRDGEIDILPTMLKTPEREKEMLFSSEKMGEIYLAVIVPKGNDNHAYGDFDFLKDGKIGVRRDTVDATTFFKWAGDNHIQYHPVIYDDQKDLLNALDSGDIDAAAMSYAGNAKRYRAIAEFAPQGMYFAITPSRQDIASKINLAMKNIMIVNPEFVSQITKEYLTEGRNSRPVFSEAEKEFIQESDPIRVTLIKQAAPFSYMEGDTFYGILPETFAHISELTGLKFTFVPVESQLEALRAVKDKKADMIGRMADNRFFAMKYDLRLTTPYVYTSMMQITRKSTDKIQSIALQGDAQQDMVIANEPKDSGRKFKVYPNINTCFEALDDGTVDAMYCDAVTALYLMETKKSSNYQVHVINDYPYNLAFGICYTKDPRLAVIIDKSLRYLNANGIDSLVIQHQIPQKMSPSAVLERLPVRYLVGIVLFLCLIIVVMAFAAYKLWHMRHVEQKMALVRERNHHIQANLEVAQKINEAKDDFFSHISHDMRTPLNGIVGFTNLALKTDEPEKKDEYMNKVKISSNLLLDLVSDTLQLSKLERGKFPLTWGVMDSHDFISQVTVPIQMMAQEKDVRFCLDSIQLKHAWIRIDRLNTQKIFLNILSNAVKFTPAGGTVTMTITSSDMTTGKFAVRTVVTDTGIGISEGFLEKIYEPFSQEQRAGTTNIPGTGLGLSIVRQLVDLLGGSIDIQSEPNQGTTVTVDLTFEEAEPLAEEAVPATVAAAPEVELLKGQKILLCEDNELNTEIARTLLEAQGIQVICAKNGQEGVTAFAASPIGDFDAIIMDIRMPVMDGYEATTHIRALERADAQTIPILAMTADAYEEDIRHCLEVGMNAHIAKPINPDQLFMQLASRLRKK